MDAIAQELERLTRKGKGVLTPSAVVDAARNPKSVLHEHFTWDDTEAASKWRERQARALISSVKLEIISSERTISAPAYIEQPDKQSAHDPGYRKTEQVADSPVMSRQAMASELKAARAYLLRAERLAEALGLVEETRAAIDSLEALVTHLEAQAA